MTGAADICEFSRGKYSCVDRAVATVKMPPTAPQAERRACAIHAAMFREIGEEVVFDADA